MLYREIITVCSEILTKHINTLCGQNVELLNVKTRSAQSNHRAPNGYNHLQIFMISHTLLTFLYYGSEMLHSRKTT
jgi:hypothetical protein